MLHTGTRQLQIRQRDMTMEVVDKLTQEPIQGVTEITVRYDMEPFTERIISKATIIIVITDENDICPVEIVDGSVESLLPAVRM